jgi:hypothetical protein
VIETSPADVEVRVITTVFVGLGEAHTIKSPFPCGRLSIVIRPADHGDWMEAGVLGENNMENRLNG